jgi:hypothetical protein
MLVTADPAKEPFAAKTETVMPDTDCPVPAFLTNPEMAPVDWASARTEETPSDSASVASVVAQRRAVSRNREVAVRARGVTVHLLRGGGTARESPTTG